MSDCIFCKIVSGAIPSKRVYEDEHLIAFHDLHPKAPVHVLVIPRRHIENFDSLVEQDAALMGHLTVTLRKVAAAAGLSDGFRTIINSGRGGRQEVYHLHYHLLGGSTLPSF